MTELRIYFASALRGGASFDELARRIAFLETIGRVLTKHMASPSTADMGHADDAAIHAHDQRLLADSDVFIADLSSPSTGSGYMAARAVAQHKPALCLHKAGTKPSAMIAGCPDITTRFYANDADFAHHVRAFLLEHAPALGDVALRGPRIFLAGPPGSGKGTLGERLAEVTGAVHVSTGELLRELVARPDRPPHAATIAAHMAAGTLVPASIMRDIVVERLRMPDCRLRGFLLDGYPPSRADLENLTAHAIVPDLVLYLECSDATAAARQVSRRARSTDTPDKARDRLAAFHEAGLDHATLASSWFPDTIVVRVDAERPPAAVEADALATIRNLLGAAERERSFFPIPPFQPDAVRSTRVHFHVDAANAELVRTIAKGIYARDKRAQGQLKIHPIRSLHLGPQIARLPVYRQMPNFHPIAESDAEAFITGRLGDGDTAMMTAVLEATRAHGGVAEMEEYIGEWTLKLDGRVVEDSRYEPLALDATFPAFAANLCKHIPRLELHLGFDVPKRSAEPPLSLAALTDACAARGLDNGGWFLFKNTEHWAYRSNEFSDADLASATSTLVAQARALRGILDEAHLACDVGFSLEKVHGVWTF